MIYKGFRTFSGDVYLEEAYQWYETQSSGLGSEFMLVIDASLSAIQRNPLAYPIVHEQIRRKLIRRFPYGIFYLFEQDTITILACYHAKREPKQWQRRIEN